MIQYSCSACGKVHTIGDEFGGRQGKCPACGNLLVIPERSQEVDPQKARESFYGRGTPASNLKVDDDPFLAWFWRC